MIIPAGDALTLHSLQWFRGQKSRARIKAKDPDSTQLLCKDAGILWEMMVVL